MATGHTCAPRAATIRPPRHCAMSAVTRLWSFYRSHGLGPTLARGTESIRRLSYGGRMILFSCVLPAPPVGHSSALSFDRHNAASLDRAEYLGVFGQRDAAARETELTARFAAGSELWLARWEGRLAAYGWTIQGGTIEPHFFPIQAEEVHFFDFFVAPGMRGRGINVALMLEVMARLGEQGVRRMHVECAAWNAAQLRSLDKCALQRNGAARMVRVFGHSLVIWD